MRRSGVPWLCALAVAALACGESVAEDEARAGSEEAGGAEVAQVRQALAEVDARWEDAANRGDAAGVASLYTHDGRLLPPDAEIAQGRESIQAVIQAYIDAGMKNVDFTPVDMGVDGELAYEIGTYTYDLEPPGGQEPLTNRGKYVIIARRQPDGTWKLVADIFNSSPPPAEGM